MVLLREQVAMAALVQLVLLPGLQLIMLVAVAVAVKVALLLEMVVPEVVVQALWRLVEQQVQHLAT
jgi:hypothetical protein